METLRNKTLTSLKWGLAIGALIIIISYGLYTMRDLISGTDVAIIYPKDGTQTNESIIDVSGHVGKVAWIKLNGGQILANESGDFIQTVMLAPGYNEIQVRAIDKFNREIDRVVRVIYTPSPLHTALNF